MIFDDVAAWLMTVSESRSPGPCNNTIQPAITIAFAAPRYASSASFGLGLLSGAPIRAVEIRRWSRPPLPLGNHRRPLLRGALPEARFSSRLTTTTYSAVFPLGFVSSCCFHDALIWTLCCFRWCYYFIFPQSRDHKVGARVELEKILIVCSGRCKIKKSYYFHKFLDVGMCFLCCLKNFEDAFEHCGKHLIFWIIHIKKIVF